MGKTRTFVGTSISRAIEDSLVPSAVKTAVENSVIKNNEMTEYMVAGLAESSAARAHRMYDFARRGLYTHGLPSGSIYTPAETGEAEVLTVLRSIEPVGADILIEYLHYGVPNNLHFGWVQLVSQYGYNTTTNELTTLSQAKGSPVYLEDMVVIVPSGNDTKIDTDSLAQWGVPARAGATPDRHPTTLGARKLLTHSPIELGPIGSQERIRVTYVWGVASNLRRETIHINVTGLSPYANYFHAAYTSDGVLKYFFYEDGAGTYALLDMVFDAPPAANGTFFPFIYFRYNRISELDDKTTQSYKTGKKMMRHLGMEYDDVARAIDANPNIADVEQAMLMMAAPANTENAIERRYLWDFFNTLLMAKEPAAQKNVEDSDVLAREINRISGFDSPGIAIQDGRFKLWVDNEGLYKRRVAGKLGRVGTYGSGFQSKPKTMEVIDPATGNPVTLTTQGSYHYYQKQVSAAFYDEIQVFGLRTVFNIFNEYNSIGDEEDPILLIPLDKAIAGRYTMPKREELYSRSLHYVFNSRVTQKVKWYQTSWFRAVLIIVMIVITIYTGGATAKELAALIAAGAYAAAAYLVLVKILETLIIRAIFKILVKELGAKYAFIIAIIAAVVGIADAMDTGSLAGSPFAQELLALSSGLTAAISTELRSNFADLAKEYALLEDWKKEQDKVLKAGKDLLGDATRLNPFVIFGEKPDEYYNRTVHSGNIGVTSIEAISQFVDIKLQLPKLQDSIGGFNDE